MDACSYYYASLLFVLLFFPFAPCSMDFMKEVKIMSRLRNGNIVRVLGVCRRGEPLSVVTEFMKYGDLHQFLLQHMPDTALNLPVDALTLR